MTEAVDQRALPSVCPVCGAFSIAPEGAASTLLAVSDVLVLRALEAVGRRLMRADRARFRELDGRPWHIAHTLWQPSDETVSKALAGAWDVVPPLLATHGVSGVTISQVTTVLDQYVHDLSITGTAHHITELAYRFRANLGLPIYYRGEREPEEASHVCT